MCGSGAAPKQRQQEVLEGMKQLENLREFLMQMIESIYDQKNNADFLGVFNAVKRKLRRFFYQFRKFIREKMGTKSLPKIMQISWEYHEPKTKFLM